MASLRNRFRKTQPLECQRTPLVFVAKVNDRLTRCFSRSTWTQNQQRSATSWSFSCGERTNTFRKLGDRRDREKVACKHRSRSPSLSETWDLVKRTEREKIRGEAWHGMGDWGNLGKTSKGAEGISYEETALATFQKPFCWNFLSTDH